MKILICDMCKKPCDDNEFFDNNKGYRFKGSFVYIRSRRFGKDTEVEEVQPTYDICMKCYNKIKTMCEADKEVENDC